MDFQPGAHYLLTMRQPGFATEPFEAVYGGDHEVGGLHYHNFVGVDQAFVWARPTIRLASRFEIESL